MISILILLVKWFTFNTFLSDGAGRMKLVWETSDATNWMKILDALTKLI